MLPAQQPTVRVGVGVLVRSSSHPGCVLVGRRKKQSHGYNKYALPGGHLEVGETWEDCAARECMEETNLTVGNVVFKTATNDIAMDGNPNKHYVTIIMQADVLPESGELMNCEPDKCFGWEWVPWCALQEMINTSPQDLFEPLARALVQLGSLET